MFSVIPYKSLYRLLKVAWIGFIVNFISGGALFSTQAVAYMQDGTFLLKMSMVIIGAILVGVMQNMIKTAIATGNAEAAAAANPKLKIVAWLAIGAWTVGMVTGRLIAYL